MEGCWAAGCSLAAAAAGGGWWLVAGSTMTEIHFTGGISESSPRRSSPLSVPQ